jgi:hypothetical protein
MTPRIPDDSRDECGLARHENALARRGRFREFSNPGKLPKLDFEAAGESLIKGLRQASAVCWEKKESNPMFRSESVNDLEHIRLVSVEDQDRRRFQISKFGPHCLNERKDNDAQAVSENRSGHERLFACIRMVCAASHDEPGTQDISYQCHSYKS